MVCFILDFHCSCMFPFFPKKFCLNKLDEAMPMANKTEQIAFRNKRIIYQLFELLSDRVPWLSVFFFAFVVACLVVFF